MRTGRLTRIWPVACGVAPVHAGRRSCTARRQERAQAALPAPRAASADAPHTCRPVIMDGAGPWPRRHPRRHPLRDGLLWRRRGPPGLRGRHPIPGRRAPDRSGLPPSFACAWPCAQRNALDLDPLDPALPPGPGRSALLAEPHAVVGRDLGEGARRRAIRDARRKVPSGCCRKAPRGHWAT